MKLQKTLKRLQKLHPKEIDLSLDRIKNLCQKLGNPQKNLNSISVVGTNGKNSTIQTMRAILDAAKVMSPNIPKDAVVPPAVGSVRTTIYGNLFFLSSFIARVTLVICDNAISDSNIRIPPDAVNKINGCLLSSAC